MLVIERTTNTNRHSEQPRALCPTRRLAECRHPMRGGNVITLCGSQDVILGGKTMHSACTLVTALKLFADGDML